MQQQNKPTERCSNCGGKIYWSKGFGWICQTDHPCPDPGSAEFIEIEEKDDKVQVR